MGTCHVTYYTLIIDHIKETRASKIEHNCLFDLQQVFANVFAIQKTTVYYRKWSRVWCCIILLYHNIQGFLLLSQCTI